MPKKTDADDLAADLKGWKRWNAFVDAANQPERLWLAELEARVDRLDAVSDSHIRLTTLQGEMLQVIGLEAIEILQEDAELQAQFSTFWGRLKWLVRG